MSVILFFVPSRHHTVTVGGLGIIVNKEFMVRENVKEVLRESSQMS